MDTPIAVLPPAGREVPTVAFELTQAGNLESVTPTNIGLLARAFTSSAPAGTTLLLRADSEGALHSHVVFPPGTGGRAANLAHALAQAVVARSTPCEVPDLSGAAVVAQVRVDVRNPWSGAAVQAGLEFRTTVAAAAQMLHRDEWMAISLRPPTQREARRNRVWRSRGMRMQTHHSLEAQPVVVSVWVGSYEAGRAEDFAARIAGLLPGFDLNVSGMTVGRRDGAGALLGTAAVLAGAGVSASVVMGASPEVAGLFASAGLDVGPGGVPWWVWGVVPAGLTAGWFWLRWSGRVPSRWRTVRRLLGWGLVPVAAAAPMRVRAPQEARTIVQVDADGHRTERHVQEYAGDYPLHPTGMQVGAHLPCALVAPHAGAKFGAADAASRLAPPQVRQPIGPVVVVDAEGPARLSAADLWSGLFISGLAGSGKTYLMEALWGWFCMQRSQWAMPVPEGTPERTTLVAFDTKEDGAASREYSAWAAKFGVGVHRFDVADPLQETGISFFRLPDPQDRSPLRWTAHDYGMEVVDALKYVYGEDAIGNRSTPSLIAVFEAAAVLHTRPWLFEPHAHLPAGRSPFWYANALIGNRDDEFGGELAALVFSAAAEVSEAEDPELVRAAQSLEPVWGPRVTPAHRRNLLDAPRSKVLPLLELEHWWSRPTQWSWDELLMAGDPVVLNLGRPQSGVGALSDLSRMQASAFAMYALYRAIKRTCVGWQEQSRAVAPFADEVKHLAENSPDVLEWFRNDARAFGVTPVFATQFPGQLEGPLRKTMLGYGNRALFAQNDAEVAKEVATNLSIDGSEWSAADVATLGEYVAAVKVTVRKQPQRAFTGRVPAFRSMSVAEFVALQHGREVVPATLPQGVGGAVVPGPGAGAAVAGRVSAGERRRLAEEARRARVVEAAAKFDEAHPGGATVPDGAAGGASAVPPSPPGGGAAGGAGLFDDDGGVPWLG